MKKPEWWRRWRMRRLLKREGYCLRHMEKMSYGYLYPFCKSCKAEEEVKREVELSEALETLRRGF